MKMEIDFGPRLQRIAQHLGAEHLIELGDKENIFWRGCFEKLGPADKDDLRLLMELSQFSISMLLEASLADEEIAKAVFGRLILPAMTFFARTHKGGFAFDPKAKKGYRLAERELEVLKLRALGKSKKEISHELGISIHTIDGALRRVFKKTGSRSTAEAVAKMRQDMLPDPVAVWREGMRTFLETVQGKSDKKHVSTSLVAPCARVLPIGHEKAQRSQSKETRPDRARLLQVAAGRRARSVFRR